ncbi:MAG: hypothetical protein U0744_12890 [Gemmataceae bacterium]
MRLSALPMLCACVFLPLTPWLKADEMSEGKHPFDRVLSFDAKSLSMEELADQLQRATATRIKVDPSFLAEKKHWEWIQRKNHDQFRELSDRFGPAPILQDELAEAEGKRLLQPLQGKFANCKLELILDRLLSPAGCKAVAMGDSIVIAHREKATELYLAQYVEVDAIDVSLDEAMSRLRKTYRLRFAFQDKVLAAKVVRVQASGIRLRDAADLLAASAGGGAKWFGDTVLITSTPSREPRIAKAASFESISAAGEKEPEPEAKKNVIPLSVEAIHRRLHQEYVIPKAMNRPLSFREMNAVLGETLPGIFFTYRVPFNPEAIPDEKAFVDQMIYFYEEGTKVRLCQLLDKSIRYMRGAQMTYLIREGTIEFCAVEDAVPERQRIVGSFVKTPLHEALRTLQRQSGLSIVVDPRLGESRNTLIDAEFASPTPLATAVRMLADIADAKVVIADGACYVTSRANMVDVPTVGSNIRKSE